MSTTHNPGPPAFLRRFVLASVVAAAATLGASAFGDPATACAKPFNQEGYGACANQVIEDWKKGEYTNAEKNELVRGCCNLAGGKIDDKSGACVAAAAAPPRLPADLPTQTLTPQPAIAPPGDITQTFEPAA